RQLELQLQMAVAARAHRLGEAPGARAQRRLRQEPEKLGSGTVGDPAYTHRRGFGAELGNAHMYIAQARAKRGGAPADDIHAIALEEQLGVDRLDARPARGVVEQAVSHAGADAEIALLRIDERELAQIALQADPH